jgi:hypothetical protein
VRGRSSRQKYPLTIPGVCSFVETVHGAPQQWYVNARSDLVPWPESLVVEVRLFGVCGELGAHTVFVSTLFRSSSSSHCNFISIIKADAFVNMYC